MKAFFCFCFLFFILPGMAQAGVLDIQIGAGTWNHKTQGEINNQGTLADMESEFGFENEVSGFYFLTFEHFLPFVPNIRLSGHSLENKSDSVVTANTEFTFAGTTYANGDNITSKLFWDEQDAIFYYSLLDNIVSFDFGIGTKAIDAKLSVTRTGTTNTLHMEETLPIAYAMASAMIPGSGFSIIVEQTSSFLGDIKINQTTSKLSYRTHFNLDLEAGYKSSTAQLDEITGVTGEVKFSGPFANILIFF